VNAWQSLGQDEVVIECGTMRLTLEEVDRMVAAESGGKTLEEVLGVFEVFASSSLIDEVYILDNVSGKRIAIAPTAFREKYKVKREA